MAKKKTTRTRPRYTARTADKHELYEISVQCPEADVRFIDRVFRRTSGRRAESLLEDFCGTALLSRNWIESRKGRTAIGVDIDEEVLEWARTHNVPPLGKRADNLTLLKKSVLDVRRPKVDCRVAFNFSYSLFLDRGDLIRYFKVARQSLKPDGMFILDLHGGPEAQEEQEESKSFPGFTYEWEQGAFNPIDSRMDCFIHFRFPDRTRMRKAFVYEWRIWGMMELRDALRDAGYSKTEVYWEGTDHETNEGNGVFLKRERVENDPSWIAYIVALP